MSEIATAQDFQTRMFNRIRESMGDMMTNEELKVIFDKAMHKAFFEERTESTNGYHTTRKPPLFIELMEQEMRPLAQKAVAEWVKDHPEEIAKALQESISKGMFNLAVQYFDQKVSFPMQQLAQAIGQNLR